MCAKDKMEDKFKLTAPFGLSGDQPQAVESLCAAFSKRTGRIRRCSASRAAARLSRWRTSSRGSTARRSSSPTTRPSPRSSTASSRSSSGKLRQLLRLLLRLLPARSPIPASDVYIEKDASVNERIEKPRLMTTKALLNGATSSSSRASRASTDSASAKLRGRDFPLACGERWERRDFMMKSARELLRAQRHDARPRYVPKPRRDDGDIPVVQRHGAAHILLRRRDRAHRRDRPGQRQQRDAQGEGGHLPSKHYITSPDARKERRGRDRKEMEECARFTSEGKYLEEERCVCARSTTLKCCSRSATARASRTIRAISTDARAGDPPGTPLDFFPKDALFFIDESHMTPPQVRGMYNGDRAQGRYSSRTASACRRASTTGR